MATLVRSLNLLFDELNAAWPHRDHRTDGWIGDSRHCPGLSDHCADSQGRVHAIDIDKDGIDASFVVGRLTRYAGVVRYINYNFYQYHVRNEFEPKKLGGTDPHTSHIHVSIEHTDTARGYSGGYGILVRDPNAPVDIPDLQIIESNLWDHSPLVNATGNVFIATGDVVQGFATAFASMRS